MLKLTNRPIYSPDELANYIARIETLDRLADKSLQNHRLLRDDRYKAQHDGYMMSILVAQRALQAMLGKVSR